MENESIIKADTIQSRIQVIRNVQVLLDSDLAELYGVELKRLNQQVKRNIERFPEDFCFQLTPYEALTLRSQNVTSNKRGGRRYLPYAFTEQGVAMLSAVLKNETAVAISIQIMKAFVNMRHYIAENAQIFYRLDSLETKQFVTDQKLVKLLDSFENKMLPPKQGIFFDGQTFDAYNFICDLIRKADLSIVLIDNYVDDTVLKMLAKRKDKVTATVFTKSIPNELKLDLQKHNSQYPPIDIEVFRDSHDRFLIIDNSEIYHIGASLKDAGKKWFAITKMDYSAYEMLNKLREALA